ncbi:MAG: ABC transporter ATP-binding protein, partial [Pseudomonadota bacterium]
LDEPTAGVDIEIRRSMWEFLQQINEAGTSIILTTHYLEEAESLCRNIAIIDSGQIVENTSMNQLLKKLQREVFVLSPANPLPAPPTLDGFETALRPDGDLEIGMNRGQTLNEMFAALQNAGITVGSMRNKSNRLEELFLNLVEDKSNRNAIA